MTPARTHLRIMVATPSHDTVPVMWAYDYASMAAHSTAAFTANLLEHPESVFEFGLTMVQGTYLHVMRQELMEGALATRASHVLWIDSDMRFPKNALLRLLAHNKAMVGINYSQRGISANGTAPDFVAVKSVEPGQKLRTSPLSVGLEEVEAIGFGLVLMDMRRVGPALGERPWFDFGRRPDGGLIGEDVYFCQKLRAAGVPIHVDHDLSRECAHIGQFEYRTDHVATLRETASGTDN